MYIISHGNKLKGNAMKLSDLIMVRDALVQAKDAMREAALSQAHIKNSLIALNYK